MGEVKPELVSMLARHLRPARVIQEEVADYFGLQEGRAAILGGQRSKTIARARKLAMWLTRQRLGYSFPEIGAAFDRDHTTVMSACKGVESAIASGESWALEARRQLCGPPETECQGFPAERVRVA